MLCTAEIVYYSGKQTKKNNKPTCNWNTLLIYKVIKLRTIVAHVTSTMHKPSQSGKYCTRLGIIAETT